MFYNRLYLRFFLFSVLFSTQCDFIIAASQKPVVNSPKIESGLVSQALNGNMDGLANLFTQLFEGRLQERIRKEAARRAALFQALPEPMRLVVDSTTKSYEKIVGLLRVEQSICVLCKDIRAGIDDTRFEKSVGQQVFINRLDKVITALQNGVFARVALPQQLAGNPYNIDITNMLQMMKQKDIGSQIDKEDLFTYADITELRKGLEVFAKNLPLKRDFTQDNDDYKVLGEKAEALISLLIAVEERDSRDLTNKCIARLEPEFEAIMQQLNHAITMLLNARLELAADADPFLKEALESWLNQFKAHRKTLKSFLALASKATIDLSDVLRATSQVYDVATAFFEADRYRLISQIDQNAGNNGQNWTTSQFLDAAWRLALVTCVGIHRTGEVANSEIQKYVLGSGSLSKFTNPLDEWTHVLTLMVATIPSAWNPSMFSERMHPVKRAFLRISGTVFWYNFVVQNGNQLRRPENLTWPSNYIGLRTAMVATIKEAQMYLDGYLHGVVYQNVDPLLLEQIETFSMGLVKPQLIDLALEIMVPMFFLRQGANVMGKLGAEGAVRFTAEDFLCYDYWFYWGLRAYLNEHGLTTASFEQNPWFYAEYKLVHYGCSNLGKFWFSTIANEFKDHAAAGLAGLATTLGYGITGLSDLVFGPGIATALIETALSDSTESYIVLRSFVASLFQEESTERLQIIGFLKNNGILGQGVNDPLEINYILVRTLLYQLTNATIFSHSQNAALLEQYVHYQHNIEPFIDLLFQQIKGNVAVWVAGGIGAKIGGMVANRIIWSSCAPRALQPIGQPQGPIVH